LLASLPSTALPGLALDLESLLRGKVRARPAPARNEEEFAAKQSNARPS